MRGKTLTIKWRLPFSSVARSLSRMQEPGCFGMPGLHEPKDWDTIAKSCIDDCVSYSDVIRSEGESPAVSVLQKFDDLSDRICSVLDVAELCRNVHPQSEFVEAAHKAYVEVSSVIQYLNADRSIYGPINALYERHQQALSSDLQSRYKLSEEDAIMVTSLKKDFERGGIHLPQDQRKQLIDLQQQLDAIGSDFVSADSETRNVVQVRPDKINNFPHSFKSVLKPSATLTGHMDVPLTASNTQMMLKWARDSSVREQAYRLSYGTESKKTRSLDSLLEKRGKVARVLGHESYAQLQFSDRLASSPVAVLDFLRRLSTFVKDSAMRERISLEGAKLRMEPQTATNGSTSIHGWDRSFYIGRLKAEDFNLSSSGISCYFPLRACLTALSDVVKRVFGITLMRVNADTSELWHCDVEKLRVVDDAEQTLGDIFLDLYPRPGKYDHAAHFSIRCGRQLSGTSEYQTPVVALVCNFGIHSHTGKRLLTMSEYETLFHEFGHSIHSILSRTKYQHLSGTRVATDLVEVPSHVFEHFAWDPRVLSAYARHYKTGEPMPTKLINSICASKQSFMGTDIQLQVLYSVMDLEFHGKNAPLGATTAAFECLQKDLTVFEPDGGVAVPANFHHFVGYGAGYYSYIFARVLSAQIWSDLFAADPFSREGGNRLRYGMLAHGASKNCANLIGNVVSGGDVTCEAFLQKIGVRVSSDAPKLHLPMSNRN